MKATANSSRSGLTLEAFFQQTARMTGPERLAAFIALPQEQQDAAWRHLRRGIDAERETA